MLLSDNGHENLLKQDKNSILQRWINLIADTYPAELRSSRIDRRLRFLL